MNNIFKKKKIVTSSSRAKFWLIFLSFILFLPIFGFAYEINEDIYLNKTNIDENEPVGTLVGNLSDSKHSGGVFRIDDSFVDGSFFKIEGNKLELNFKPNYERRSEYRIRVLEDVKDGDKTKTFEKEFTITINDVNKAPSELRLQQTVYNITKKYITNKISKIIAKDDGENGPLSIELVDKEIDNPNYVPMTDDEKKIVEINKKLKTKFDAYEERLQKAFKGHKKAVFTPDVDPANDPKHKRRIMASELFEVQGYVLKLKQKISEEYTGVKSFPVTLKVSDGEKELTKTFNITIAGNEPKEKRKRKTYAFERMMSKIAAGIGYCMISNKVAQTHTKACTAVDDIKAVPTNPQGLKKIASATPAKQCGLDYVANAIKQSLLEQLVKGATEWIKGGFKGEPAFLRHPDQFLESAATKFMSKMFGGNADVGLCRSFSDQVENDMNSLFGGIGSSGISSSDLGNILGDALGVDMSNMKDGDSSMCSLPDEFQEKNQLNELSNFLDDNGNFDPDKYWEVQMLKLQPQNDYVTMRNMMRNRISQAIAKENADAMADVNRGNGFMSMKKCNSVNIGTYSNSQLRNACSSQFTSCLEAAKQNEMEREVCRSQFEKCVTYKVKVTCKYTTPGSLIQNEIAERIGIPRKSVENADTFNEVMFTLINNLIDKIFSDDGIVDVTEEDIETEAPLESLQVERMSALKMYNPLSFELEAFIRGEIVKIYHRYIEFLDATLSNWEKLSEKMYRTNDGKIFVKDSDPADYEWLTQNTIDQVKEKLQKKILKATKELDKQEEQISMIESVDASFVEEQINNAETVDQIQAAVEGMPVAEISAAYNEYMELASLEDEVNGSVSGYQGQNPTYSGGLFLVDLYGDTFKSEKPKDENGKEIADDKIMESLSWGAILNLEVTSMKRIPMMEKNTTYNIEERIRSYNAELEQKVYSFDPDKDESMFVGVGNQYTSLISEETPGFPAPGVKEKVDTWKKFFEFGALTKLDKSNKANAKEYLAFLKERSELSGWDTVLKQTYKYQTYKWYSLLINNYAYYPQGTPKLKHGTRIPGQGQYRTNSDDGSSWSSYKAYIPPFTKKLVLRFKPEDADENKKYLYRVHLTYNTGVIDHRGGPHKKGVKELDLKIPSSTDAKSSVSDLFEKKKTVLLNITYNTKDLGAELESGVYTDGVIFGPNELAAVNKKDGGWMYIDVIKDNFALYKGPERDSYLQFGFYMDIDKESPKYTEFLAKADILANGNDEVAVIDIDNKGTNPVVTLIGEKNIKIIKGSQKYKEPGISIVSYDHKQSMNCNETNANNPKLRLSCIIKGDVNTDKVGKYIVKYTAFDLNPKDIKRYMQTTYRIVEVVENKLQINLKGSDPYQIEKGTEEYKDPGIEVTNALGEKIPDDKVNITVDVSDIDLNRNGTYKVEYTAVADGYITGHKVRKVEVIDHTIPVIELKGEQEIILEAGESYIEPGYTATDNEQRNITDRVVVVDNIDNHKVGEYRVEYSVTDKFGNKANKVQRKVKVVDTKAPEISLFGKIPLNWERGKEYRDPGGIAKDQTALADYLQIDTSKVDVTKPGEYLVYYRVSDTSGNKAEVMRKVIVK